MRLACVCMHRKCFFFPNKIYKKACNFFQNGCKKIVFITKCNEKNCLKRITLYKKLSASPKNGTPPPPPIKNNGPTLTASSCLGFSLKLRLKGKQLKGPQELQKRFFKLNNSGNCIITNTGCIESELKC